MRLAGTVALWGVMLVPFGAAHADPRVPPGATSCAGCHARTGPGGPIPRIHGRPRREIAAFMAAFRSGRVRATVMDRIAKGFSDEEIDAIAAWLSQQR
jgi:cytochrome c553